MTYLVVAASIVLFLFSFKLLGIAAVARAAVEETRQTAALLRDATLDDEQKEARLQRASVDLFVKLLSMVLRAAVCTILSIIPVALGSWSGIAPEEQVIPLFYSWEVIVVSTLAFVFVWRWK